ncbi:MAG: aminoacyl-tRNA hydrolase [Candidatus Paceibacterota bacterium]|jgi:PTH1 family peptidyl-tRNA hydrolase
MSYIIVGLGNPGEEYLNTRHNTGRMALEAFRKKMDFSDWQEDKKLKAEVSEGKTAKEKTTLICPDTFMNKSGEAVKKIKDLKLKIIGKGKDKRSELANLVVIHDDLDIPFGKFKISFNKSSGGHKGVESIMKAVKTEGFIRIRVGISPVNAKGVVKKPLGEEAVGDFILGKFKPVELEAFNKMGKVIAEAIEMIVSEGRERAMGIFNQV